MATSAPLQPAAPQRGIKALLARHPLVSFFVRLMLSRGSCGRRGCSARMAPMCSRLH